MNFAQALQGIQGGCNGCVSLLCIEIRHDGIAHIVGYLATMFDNTAGNDFEKFLDEFRYILGGKLIG